MKQYRKSYLRNKDKYELGVDWAHNKDFVIYDGDSIFCFSRAKFVKYLKYLVGGSESNDSINSMQHIQLPPKPNKSKKLIVVYIEQGCPMYLVSEMMLVGVIVVFVRPMDVFNYRETNNIEKTDENDAKIIYQIGKKSKQEKVPVINEKLLEIHRNYHKYCLYVKARTNIMRIKCGHIRSYGISDCQAYDDCIKTLRLQSRKLMSKLEREIRFIKQEPNIRGLGRRLWVGIIVSANPTYFKSVSSYLRYCGLVNHKTLENMSNGGGAYYKFSRHANMLYRLISENVVKWDKGYYRGLYDKLKNDMTNKYGGERKFRINNATLNRLSTFIAKDIYNYCNNLSMNHNIIPESDWHLANNRICLSCGFRRGVKIPKSRVKTRCPKCGERSMELIHL